MRGAIHVALAHAHVGHPAEALHLVIAALTALDEIDTSIRVWCIERPIIDASRNVWRSKSVHRRFVHSTSQPHGYGLPTWATQCANVVWSDLGRSGEAEAPACLQDIDRHVVYEQGDQQGDPPY